VSVVWSCRAKYSFASSRAAIAEGRPASLKSVIVGVVLQTGRTPLAAKVSALSIISTCQPTWVLTILTGPCNPRSLVLPVYQASVPYRADGSMQAITALHSTEAGGLSVVLAVPGYVVRRSWL
jgi:hypothetical protein